MCRARQAESLPPDSLSRRSPPTLIDRWVGVPSPPRRFRSVVLPEPDGPIRARKSPSGISSVTPWRTSIRWPPRWNTLWRSRTATREFDMITAPFLTGGLRPAGPPYTPARGGPVPRSACVAHSLPLVRRGYCTLTLSPSFSYRWLRPAVPPPHLLP